MEKHKKIILVAGLFLVIILIILFFFVIKSKNSKPEDLKNAVQNENSNPANEEYQQISGTVEKITPESMIIKDIAEGGGEYEIKKENVSSVIEFKRNEDFDETEYNEIMKDMSLSVEKEKDVETHKLSEEEMKKKVEAQNKIMEDASLQAYNSEESDWSKIEVGKQVVIDMSGESKKIIIVPEGFLAGAE